MNQTASDIRDVRPPVDVPGISLWVWIILILFLVTAIGIYFYWKWYRARKSRAAVAAKTSWETAYERLAELERQNFFAQGKIKEYFSGLSDIVRRYIEDRFNIHAPDMTTEEFLNSVKTNPFIEQKHKDILKKFLILSDMVKFAKYGPNVSEARETFELAQKFVDETKVEEQPALPKT